MSILGVVMAGGRNQRFGDLKAFAEVGGVRIIDRVIRALRSVCDEVVMSANDVEAYRSLGLPMRPDIHEGIGALGGLHAALRWADERGDRGILAAACDMPFPSAGLLRDIVAQSELHDVVIPQSDGRRGVEPLFAFYAVTCLPAVETAIARGDPRMISFHDDVDVLRIPVDEVRAHGEPAVLFMNVNTREDLESARRIAEQAS